MIKTLLITGLMTFSLAAAAGDWKGTQAELDCLKDVETEMMVTPKAILQSICEANGKGSKCVYEDKYVFQKDFFSYVEKRCKGLKK